MTTTDPITLAREVLDLTQENETITVCSIPDNKVADLARAYLDLAARVRDLAVEFDLESSGRTEYAIAMGDACCRIRAALNGDPA